MKKNDFLNKWLIIVLIGIGSNVFSQIPSKTKLWKDGDPTFSKTRPSIITHEFVTFTDESKTALGLTPQFGTLSDDTLNLALDGVDWTWPPGINISNAQDIDYRIVGGQKLYMVVDASARKVIEYNLNTKLLSWEYGSNEPSNPEYLDRPVDSHVYKDQDDFFKVLITDKTNHRVVKINQTTKAEEWTYGTLGLEGRGQYQLSNPEDAINIPGEKKYIIVDGGNDRVIIVDDSTRSILWESWPGLLNSPVDVEYMADSNFVLITDKGNSRIVLVDPDLNRIVWEYDGKPGSVLEPALKTPSDADILENGNILIADEGNQRLLEVDLDKNIVWEFGKKIAGLKDADRLPDNKHIAIHRDATVDLSRPIRYGYSNHSFNSAVYDLQKEVIFDSLFWEAKELSENIKIKFQLRSANSLSDLEVAKWFGPSGETDFYLLSGEKLNVEHTGDRYFQFKADFITDNPLYTPVLQKLIVNFKYFKTGVAPNTFLADPIIPVTDDTTLVTQWMTLEFNTTIPDDPVLKEKINMEVQIRLYDGDRYPLLASFPASKSNENNTFSLESNTKLQGHQNVYLFGSISTTNSSVTPILNDWSMTYKVVDAVNSDLFFAGTDGEKRTFLRAPVSLPSMEAKVDSVDIHLVDFDLQAFQDTLTVNVKAQLSGDSENIILQTNGEGTFAPVPKVPLLISTSMVANNLVMEVQDRDTLSVTYNDPNNPSDSSTTSVFVVQNTAGNLTIVDKNGADFEKVNFSDMLYLKMSDENDQNLDPNGQDTIYVQLFDRATFDEENVTMIETANSNGKYNTGEFQSDAGIRVVLQNNGIIGDGQLQALAGHTITAEYVDNLTLRAEVRVRDDGGNGVVNIYLGGEPYLVEVGPNPFYEQEQGIFKIRVASATGDIKVRLLEIFNLAGEKVTEINGNSLVFNVGTLIPREKYGIAENWWDLTNDSGQHVASGTYFVKVHADLQHTDTNNFESVTYLRKFVLVR